MTYHHDKRIVLTLDAGGTNFVFSAIQCMREVVTPVRLPAYADDLERSLESFVKGFTMVWDQLSSDPCAISFAFPGMADYPNGIIHNIGNMPAYRGGVALGAFLEEKFQLPVFINNDGDLFAYGEAMCGFLPKVNEMLKTAKSPKRFKKLFGITLGTGFGSGLVCDGQLYIGDNAAAGEIRFMRNKRHPHAFAEEGVSIRAIKRIYARRTGIELTECPEPKVIYNIGMGHHPGNRQAACEAFQEMGEVIGDALANAITLLDGLIVIGGGMANAYPLFIDAILKEMNGTIAHFGGEPSPRIAQRCFNLEDPLQQAVFVRGEIHEIRIPRMQKTIRCDAMMRLGIGKAVMDTHKAVSVGAYTYALSQLDRDSRVPFEIVDIGIPKTKTKKGFPEKKL